jgi:exosortase/archaeosortase family protein
VNDQFSFIVLTYNEELHLQRLLNSISQLDAAVYILDSGSTDTTLDIAKKYGAHVLVNKFENHPRQWDFALRNFDIKTPWVICLDADQVVSPELNQKLAAFKDADFNDIDGIYFNRKNYFKGRWLKHGGYYPFYMLKMFRYGKGYSDLNENMDHRFIVPGKSVVWKDGHILEENLKENNIRFWIEKHNRYSDLVAHEEIERMQKTRSQTVQPNFWGTPDERTARLKQVWWQLPLYVRPMIYFIYRFIFRLGILDGREGTIFHFLQGYWFRLIVDIKIDEIRQQKDGYANNGSWVRPVKFVFTFLFLFLLFYFFNVFYFGLTTPGNNYSAFLAHHLNYIQWLRQLLLDTSTGIINLFGYTAINNNNELLVAGHGMIVLVYSCLGLGVISFFTAFVIAYPKPWRQKLIFIVAGILVIEALNIIRFVLLAIFWDKHSPQIVDHHTIFNIAIYILIFISLYFWMKSSNKTIQA